MLHRWSLLSWGDGLIRSPFHIWPSAAAVLTGTQQQVVVFYWTRQKKSERRILLDVRLSSSLQPQSRKLLLICPHEAPTQTETQSGLSPHLRRLCCLHDVTTVVYFTLQCLRVCKHVHLMLSACFLYKPRRKFWSFYDGQKEGGLYFRGQIRPSTPGLYLPEDFIFVVCVFICSARFVSWSACAGVEQVDSAALRTDLGGGPTLHQLLCTSLVHRWLPWSFVRLLGLTKRFRETRRSVQRTVLRFLFIYLFIVVDVLILLLFCSPAAPLVHPVKTWTSASTCFNKSKVSVWAWGQPLWVTAETAACTVQRCCSSALLRVFNAGNQTHVFKTREFTVLHICC